MGLVGESGCGKSVVAQSILCLYDEKLQVSYEGAIRFEGRDLFSVPLKRMPEIRGGRIAMIFQDPLSALDPVFTVGSQIVETIRRHDRVPGREAALIYENYIDEKALMKVLDFLKRNLHRHMMIETFMKSVPYVEREEFQ